MSADEFGNKIGRLTNSGAYLEYCAETYGYREFFFNMTDKAQIDYLMNSVPLSAGDTVADLGCGSGSILNLLCAKHNCHGIGIDRLDEACFKLKSNKITYIKADIDNISEHNIKPTVIISVDSLYFCQDLSGLISQLKATGCGRMFLFYSQYLFDGQTADRNLLQSDRTMLAEALRNNGLPFQTVDYRENESQLYKNSLITLRKYEKAFEAEGNADLYEQKYREDSLGAELYRNGLAARYLYTVDAFS